MLLHLPASGENVGKLYMRKNWGVASIVGLAPPSFSQARMQVRLPKAKGEMGKRLKGKKEVNS